MFDGLITQQAAFLGSITKCLLRVEDVMTNAVMRCVTGFVIMPRLASKARRIRPI